MGIDNYYYIKCQGAERKNRRACQKVDNKTDGKQGSCQIKILISYFDTVNISENMGSYRRDSNWFISARL